jgi:hypothetical protein
MDRHLSNCSLLNKAVDGWLMAPSTYVPCIALALKCSIKNNEAALGQPVFGSPHVCVKVVFVHPLSRSWH